MELVDTLKFVRGAVANRSTMFEMKHYAIESGHIRATNGVLTLGCPIEFATDCAPQADALFKAIGNCNDVVSMHLTPTNRLRVKSGRFSALIPCVEMNNLPHPKPSGMPVEFPAGAVVQAFERLAPFVCTDTVRPWANGILFRGSSAYATNNTTLAECWLGIPVPFTVTIPLAAVKEVLRVKDDPTRILMDHNSVTFMYGDGRWIKTQLYESDWPPLEKVLDVAASADPVPPDLFDALDALKDYPGDGRVYFRGGHICTARSDDEDGATYEVAGLPDGGVYQAKMLRLMDGVATHVDFSRYPKPALFFGDRIRGAVMAFNE